MKARYTLAMLAMVILLPFDSSAGLFNKKEADEKRAEIQEMRSEVLARLYKEKPELEGVVAESVGYAVFNNTGINVLVLSTGNGKGVVRDNANDKDTYMKMFSAGAGLGAGVKKFSAVFVFHERDAFDQFVDKGWNFTGQADAAATTDAEEGKGAGAADSAGTINESVSVYQLTDKGLALQVTLQGTKYWKDDDLNQN